MEMRLKSSSHVFLYLYLTAADWMSLMAVEPTLEWTLEVDVDINAEVGTVDIEYVACFAYTIIHPFSPLVLR